MVKYLTTYKDEYGKILTEIENRFDEKLHFSLSIDLNGVQFQGSSFDDFELIEPHKYTEKQLQRFTFNKVKVWKSEKYILELCNCELKFEIPLSLIDKQNDTEISTNLLVHLILGKPALNGGIDSEKATFSIELQGKIYSSEGDVFENPLAEIQNQFNGKFHFKNCFGCLYSDYSPYGNGFFGDMLCLKNCKSKYLKAYSKKELLKIMKQNSINVQETFLCEEFMIRIKHTGYRG